jgi:hypothetical protein
MLQNATSILNATFLQGSVYMATYIIRVKLKMASWVEDYSQIQNLFFPRNILLNIANNKHSSDFIKNSLIGT